MSRSVRLIGRTLARCQALQILFQAEACDRAVDDVLAGDYILSKGPIDEYGERIARGVGEHLPELDAVLSGAARNWSLSRMSSTDRNLLRLSLYELLYVDEVEAAVSISECVLLAKAFGSSDESSRFVNGILGRIESEIEAGTDVVAKARSRELEEASELAAAADAGEAAARGYVPEPGAEGEDTQGDGLAAEPESDASEQEAPAADEAAEPAPAGDATSTEAE